MPPSNPRRPIALTTPPRRPRNPWARRSRPGRMPRRLTRSLTPRNRPKLMIPNRRSVAMTDPGLRDPSADVSLNWARRLMGTTARVDAPAAASEGRIVRVVGLALEARGLSALIGDQCEVTDPQGRRFEAEVVGFAEEATYLMPLETTQGVGPGCRVKNLGTASRVPMGEQLLGRVLDARGRPIDDGERLTGDASVNLHGRPINPLKRREITEP